MFFPEYKINTKTDTTINNTINVFIVHNDLGILLSLFTLFLHPLNRLFVGGREPPMTGGGSDDHLLRGADTIYNRHDGSGRTGLVVVTEGVEAGHFDQFGKVHYIVVG